MTRKKKIILIIIVVSVLIFSAYKIFFRQEETNFTLEKVQKGTIVQEVSENGTIARGDGVTLGFKSVGKIEAVYVKVGDEVSSGQKLAKLETTQLSLQLAQAQANASAQRARLSELQKGADTDLNSYYNNAPTILNQAYNLADSAIRQQVASLFVYRSEVVTPYFELTYKNCDSQAAADVAAQRKISEDKLVAWRAELQSLGTTQRQLDDAIGKALDYLKIFQGFLNRLNDTLSTDCKLSSEEITRINANKSLVNLATTNLNTALSSVSTQKETIASRKLAVQNSSSNQEQINYQQALVDQAETGVVLLQNQIQDAVLLSPTDGQIFQIEKRVGEIIQITEPLAVLLPKSPFQIEADIYEEDIVKVKLGDSVAISPTAFPDQTFEGKVISIDPSSKLIDGVVYYGIKIDFQNPPQETRPGMSADIVIKTAQKDNVLMVSEGVVEKKDGKTFVQIVKDEKLTEKEIQTGLAGNAGMIEVISGLSEGEEVAIPK